MPGTLVSDHMIHVPGQCMAIYLAHACAVVFGESVCHAVGRGPNLTYMLAIRVLRISAHTGNGQHLLVFFDTLLEFPEEDPET